MEEIALLFSSVAGACTAVALDKVPKIKRKQTPTLNSAISNQLQSLRMEKEILSKTITRLNHQDSQISKIQKDKLLLRYQHQLGTVLSKIEKLELANRYPDLGPVGDSLISLMDNRLSQLDQKLHEISSKITIGSSPQSIQIEKPVEHIQNKKIEPKIEIKETPRQKIEIQKESEIIEKPVQVIEQRHEIVPLIEVPTFEKHRMVELSTLTEITNKVPQFPVELIKPVVIEEPIMEEPKIEIVPEQELKPIVKEEAVQELPKPEAVQEAEKKIQLPAAIKIPEEEKLEDDDKDLDKIKIEIMKALSKLEQVEVE